MTDTGDRTTTPRFGQAPSDVAMTRSEEQLRVGVQARPVGRAVLRKYIVTEEVTQTVTLRREEVRLEQLPADEAAPVGLGAPFEHEEYEVVLHEERPVLTTQIVPVERVRLVKDVVTEQVQVADSLRKEQLALDVDPADAV